MTTPSSQQIETFLARLRGSHPDMETIFMRGSCYELFQIMRVLWPEAIPWYVQPEGHVYVQIGPWFYDIRGRHRELPGVRQGAAMAVNLLQERGGHPPHRWSKGTHLRLKELGQRIDVDIEVSGETEDDRRSRMAAIAAAAEALHAKQWADDPYQPTSADVPGWCKRCATCEYFLSRSAPRIEDRCTDQMLNRLGVDASTVSETAGWCAVQDALKDQDETCRHWTVPESRGASESRPIDREEVAS